jgi:hypothetical protein
MTLLLNIFSFIIQIFWTWSGSDTFFFFRLSLGGGGGKKRSSASFIFAQPMQQIFTYLVSHKFMLCNVLMMAFHVLYSHVWGILSMYDAKLCKLYAFCWHVEISTSSFLHTFSLSFVEWLEGYDWHVFELSNLLTDFIFFAEIFTFFLLSKKLKNYFQILVAIKISKLSTLFFAHF